MAETRSYSLDEDVLKVVDSVPKKERSKFVSSRLRRAFAIEDEQRSKALKALKDIVPIKGKDKKSSVELLAESRQQRTDHLSNN